MNLTDRQFWLDYWENKGGNLAVKIPEKYLFHDILKDAVRKKCPKRAIELGGFPGYYAIFLKKWLGVETSLLDYVIHEGTLKDVLGKNGMSENSIEVLEADLFQFQPKTKFDLVLSAGLVEHFENTEDIIQQHIKFLSDKGTLFIAIPNFRSFNGFLQRKFDPENYAKHHIECMDIAFLKDIMEFWAFKELRVDYHGGFMMWLENLENKPVLFRVGFNLVWGGLKVFFKLFPIKSRYFSPYIYVLASR